MIEFSVPLMFANDYIDKIVKLNNETTKSKITSVYNCFPMNLPNKSGFEQVRVSRNNGIEKEEDFFYHTQKAQDAGLEFIYVLNSPRGVSQNEFDNITDKVDKFIENLLKNGVHIVRITNTQLINYLSNKYPELEIRTSTSQEYTNIKQFKNLFTTFPNITEVVPSWNLNKNFTFIKSFTKSFPQKIELMINEGCLSGCPFRIHHTATLHDTSIFNRTNTTKNYNRIPKRFSLCMMELCSKNYNTNFWESICMSNVIYPWEISTYAEKYNITKFKLVGRSGDFELLRNGKYFNIYEFYIKGVEDYNIIKNVPFAFFSHYTISNDFKKMFGEELTVDQIKKYLPDIKHFEINGNKCNSICGVECNYCYKLADSLQKKFPHYFTSIYESETNFPLSKM